VIPERGKTLGVALIAATSILGCGGGEQAPEQGNGDAAPATATADRVRIEGFAYTPAAVRVRPGTKLTFTNEDSAPHTATSTQSGVFSTDTLRKGRSRSVTLDRPGSYEYFCQFHPFMKGRVEVR
jgi:plastocyanin